MTDDECLKRFGLSPAPESAPEIRRLLATQTELERNCQGDADGELMLLNCIQLFALGQASDSLLIWAAKQSSFDKGFYIDGQLLCGAGIKETLGYLDGVETDRAKKAADYIRKCVASGDFDGFTPQKWVSEYRDYFGG